MPEFGVTENGFVLKRLFNILADLRDALSTVADPITGENLTPDLADENDPLIQVMNSFADGLADAWEKLQAANNQFDPLLSTGAGLTGVVQLNNLRRLPGTESTVSVTITGTALLEVDAGKRVSRIDDSSVFILPAFTIGTGGSILVEAESVDQGPIEALSGELVKIVTPVSGWDAVTNALDAILGTLKESDTDLLARQQQSTANTGRSTIEDMYSALANLANVTFVKVYQNVDIVVDERGIPGKAVAVVVQGGDVDEISEQIFLHMAEGMKSFGNTVAFQTDLQGIIYSTDFSRPTEIPIYVYVEVVIIDFSRWPDNGVDVITANILDYVSLGAGALDINSGFDREGFLPGEDILASELYTPVNSQAGLKINTIQVDTELLPDQDVVDIDWNEVGVFDASRIEVNVVVES